ncbi:uncharacterized protein LOC129922876 isoform X2 [Biomphalaria glabrata]|nr:uncharacterized protein LOC129922876 isoform X2 [Biomphalaria glabrata]
MKENGSSFLICLGMFSELCDIKTNLMCSCSSTENPNIYNIMLSTNLTDSDKYTFVRAGIINKNGERLYSKAMQLSRNSETVAINDSIDVQINNHQVDINDCSVVTSNDIIHISYNSTMNELVSVKVYNSNSIEVVNEGSREITIKRKFLEKVQSITLQMHFCHVNIQNVTCSIITENELTTEKIEEYFDYADLYINLIVLVCIVLLSAFLCYMHRRNKARKLRAGLVK